MKSMSRQFKIIFTASVLLNIVFLGFVGGAMYKHMTYRPWDLYKEQLQPETRHLMARIFESNHNELKSKVGKARKEKERLMELLTADSFSRDKVETELRKFHRMQGDIREQKLMSLLDLAEQLPREEREKLAVLFDGALSDRPHHAKKRMQKMGKSTPVPEHKP